MSHMARKDTPHTDAVTTPDDDGSTVRSRDSRASVRPRQESSPELRASAAPRRTQSSTRPALGSLDDRLEKKMQVAAALMKDLPPTDSRVRLLYVAIMRRDEALLDGLLSELNKLPPSR